MKNVLCARGGYRKHNKHKSSSSYTHFVHGLCPSNSLAVLIFDQFLILFAIKRGTLKIIVGVPGWLSWLGSQLLVSAQVMIPGSWDPALCWALLLSGESASLPPPLPPLALMLSLFQINKSFIKNRGSMHTLTFIKVNKDVACTKKSVKIFNIIQSHFHIQRLYN